MTFNKHSIFDADDVVIHLSDGDDEIVASISEITVEHDFQGDRHICDIHAAVKGKFQPDDA